MALVGMAFLAVLREGFETSVFLLAAFQDSTDATAAGAGAILGLVAAILIGVGLYRGGVRINLGRFFQELIDEHGSRWPHHCCLRYVLLHGVHVVRNDHRSPAKHVTRPHQNRHADLAGHTRRFFRN